MKYRKASKREYKTILDKNVLIPMPDGIDLAADIYKPNKKGVYPAVITYYPYRKDDFLKSYVESRIKYLVERGYVGMMIDTRGTGSSGGYTERMLSDAETQDGYHAIRWTADQEWCDGNVGMMGVSYGGFTSYLLPTKNPPELRAVVPIYANDDWYEASFPGGNFRTFHRAGIYGAMMLAMNSLPPLTDEGRWLEVWNHHLENNQPWLLSWLNNQVDGKIWQESSISKLYEKVNTPMYMIGGWHDIYPAAPLRLYEKINAPKKLLMGPWQHIAPNIGIPGPRVDYLYETVRWFDYWMKDVDTGIMDEPPITIFTREYDKPAPIRANESGFWRTELEWPIKGTENNALFFHSDNRLESSPPEKINDETVYDYDPTVGESLGLYRMGLGLGWGLPLDQRRDEAKSVNYTTNELDDQIEVTGFPKCVIFISSTAKIVTFVVKLSDVSPKGESSLVSRGSMNATHRKSHEKPEELTPNEKYKLEITLDPISYVFKKGHRIRVSISSADFPFIWPTPENAVNRIYTNRDSPSHIIMPMIPKSNKIIEPPFNTYTNTDMLKGEGNISEYSITEDLLKGRKTWVLDYSEDLTVSEKHEVKSSHRMKAELDTSNPANVNVDAVHKMSFRHKNITAEVEASTKIISSVNDFYTTAILNVKLGNAEYFKKKWIESIPRNYC